MRVLPLLSALLPLACSAQHAPLALRATIPLPGVHGRIDHLALDPDGSRLFVAALGNGSVEVVDLRAKTRLTSLANLEEPQGIVFVPRHRRLYVATGGDGLVHVYDGATLAPLRTVSLGSDADNVRYDVRRDRVYVGYGEGGIAALDAASGELIGRAELDGHPEAFAVTEDGTRIYANVPSRHVVAVISTDDMRLEGTIAVRQRANFPLALDATRGRLLVGCRTPACIAAFGIDDRRPLFTLPIAGDVDDLFCAAADADLPPRLYASCGQGGVNVFEEDRAGAYHDAGHVETAPGARTSLYVPDLRTLFVAAPARDDHPAEILLLATP